ncbi:MAG TPA: hypothetical protein VF960_10845 [Chloroflexota bacterium]
MGEEPNGKVPWNVYHDDVMSLRDTLFEIRDSVGAVHVRMDGLPCDAHIEIYNKLAADVEMLKANAIPWRRLGALVRPRFVVALIATALSYVGWERGADIVRQIGR